MRRLTHRVLLAVTLAAVVAGCGSTTPGPSAPAGTGVRSSAAATARTPSPSGPPILGIDWTRATSVEAPSNFGVDPSDPPYTGTHPILRIPGQATIADVGQLSDGSFVAVGYVPPDWLPVAWTSPDGQTWSIHVLGTTTFTFPVALATGTDGSALAVGRSGKLPVAWTSADGVTWQERSVPTLGSPAVAERMTSVVAGSPGYIAGGSVGPELFDRHARFWTSVDGSAWQPVADEPAAFDNAEVRAITRSGGRLRCRRCRGHGPASNGRSRLDVDGRVDLDTRRRPRVRPGHRGRHRARAVWWRDCRGVRPRPSQRRRVDIARWTDVDAGTR